MRVNRDRSPHRRNDRKWIDRPHERLPNWRIDHHLCGRLGTKEPPGTRSSSGPINLSHCYLMIYLHPTRLRIVDLEL